MIITFSIFFYLRRLIEPIQSGITMDIEWTKPVETYGELKGYFVKYGKRGGPLTEIQITDKDVQHQQISNLEKGIEYEFRVAGYNEVGPGQEAIALYLTPEGMPTDSPKNISTRFQTPDVIEISYDPPPEEARNGQVNTLLYLLHNNFGKIFLEKIGK